MQSPCHLHQQPPSLKTARGTSPERPSPHPASPARMHVVGPNGCARRAAAPELLQTPLPSSSWAASQGATIAYRGPMDVVRDVLATRGAGSMMRRLAPTLVREVTGTAIMFAVYEAGKRRLAQAQARQPACQSGGTHCGSWARACIGIPMQEAGRPWPSRCAVRVACLP